jgi:drug/metabolite transporter (DMT)-like permease
MPFTTRPARRALIMDALLLLMVLIWGGNYSLIKATLSALPPRPFNAVRMAVASATFAALLGAMWLRQHRRAITQTSGSPSPPGTVASPSGALASAVIERILGVSRPAPADWLRILAAGLVGHALYQVLFIEGLARTTAANAALLIGCSPIVVSIASAVVGHDRLARGQWAGLGLSFCGVYLVVGRAAAIGHAGATGDLLMLGAVLCWAVYAVLSRSLLDRHSPLFVTGWTMMVGTVCFTTAVWRDVVRVDWSGLPAWAWNATILSALSALTLAYLIYYVSVMRIGVARTTVWTNVTPLVGMVIAWTTLGEPVDPWQVSGGALILAGVGVTRLARRPATAVNEGPAE